MSSLKSVRTPKLDIGYEEQGNLDGFPIVLLHGFPYDIRSWDGVVPLLSANGFRVLVPYLRGFGATKIIDPVLPKTGQQTAIAQDVIDFTQALGINHYALSGFDWGNRAACIASILNPKQVKALVTIGGYAVQNTVNPPGPASAVDEAKRWYVWYLNTKQGKIGLAENRHVIIFHLWKSWAPKWSYTQETYKNSAKSFDNEDNNPLLKKVNKLKKLKDFKNFKVDFKVMNYAKKNAIFLHCLPRGTEVSNDVFLSKRSKVWQQAFNRIFVQKSILLYCLGKLR